jgi:hypothetical protein
MNPAAVYGTLNATEYSIQVPDGSRLKGKQVQLLCGPAAVKEEFSHKATGKPGRLRE